MPVVRDSIMSFRHYTRSAAMTEQLQTLDKVGSIDYTHSNVFKILHVLITEVDYKQSHLSYRYSTQASV